ncbi:hypothetical protein KIW84_052105, partial [Lathyrus oleraceus]
MDFTHVNRRILRLAALNQVMLNLINMRILNINTCSSKDSGADESEVVCLCQCCPHCLRSLYHLMRKILVRVWGSNRSHWTIEDVHDAVSTLSVDLISAVRKSYMTEEKAFTDL